MGRKDKNKKKGKGAEKTAMKTIKKMAMKQKKLLEKIGEADIAEVVATLEAEEARLRTVTETVCGHPTPRSSFSFVPHPEKEELILFGGEFFNGQKMDVYNDLYIYNIAKKEWKLVKSPSGPTPRSGHQMVGVSTDGGQLWLFGGEHASPSQLQYYHYRDLWVYKLKAKCWEKINAPGGPSARSGHRMVASKKKLILFGGFYDNNQSYQYYNDVHMFSLETYGWLKIEISGANSPSPRSGCCIAAYPDGKILIWGGYTKAPMKKDADRGVTHTDMFLLQPDKLAPNNKFSWSAVKPGGIRPLPRSSVSYAASASNKVYCFGGVMDSHEDEEDIRGQFGSDLYCLDLSASPSWRLLEIGKKRSGNNNNSSTAVTQKTQSSTDGVFTITIEDRKPENSGLSVSNQENTKTGPSPRMSPGMCVCKGLLYIFGGIFEENNKQCTFNDFYCLNIHKIDEWRTIIPQDVNAHDWVDSESSSSEAETEEDDEEYTDENFTDEETDSESEMETD